MTTAVEQTMMQLTATRETLRDVLATVAGAAPMRSALPVLSCALLEAGDDGLTVTGTDLDMWVRVRSHVEVDEPGALCVPAKRLLDLSKLLPEAPARIAMSKKGMAKITCGSGTFELHGVDSDEFPTQPDFGVGGLTVGAGALLDAIHQTAFACSTEADRPVLNGARLTIGGGKLALVATSGHVLARYRVATAGDLDEAIIPTRALVQLAKLFDRDDLIEIARLGNYASFREERVEVHTRLVEGPYPKYEQAIPDNLDKVCIADTARVLDALRRVAVVASDQTHRTAWLFDEGRLTLEATTPGVGTAEEMIEVDYTGEAIRIGFNAKYALSVLSRIPTSEVRIGMVASERAATFEPVGDDAPDYLTLVMPMRLLD